MREGERGRGGENDQASPPGALGSHAIKSASPEASDVRDQGKEEGRGGKGKKEGRKKRKRERQHLRFDLCRCQTIIAMLYLDSSSLRNRGAVEKEGGKREKKKRGGHSRGFSPRRSFTIHHIFRRRIHAEREGGEGGKKKKKEGKERDLGVDTEIIISNISRMYSPASS